MKKVTLLGVLCLACCTADNTSPTADSTTVTADQSCGQVNMTIRSDGAPVITNSVLIAYYPSQFFRLKIEPAALITQATTNLSGPWTDIFTNPASGGGQFELELRLW